MIIFAGLSGMQRTPSPSRWSGQLDQDFAAYVVEGLRRLLQAGVHVDVNLISGFRTYQKQAALYRQNPRIAARPGLSQHEYGYAVDLGIILPRQETFITEILNIFGIPFEQDQRRFQQAILEGTYGDILYPRSNDPGHLGYYSDEDWHDALQAAGYLDVAPAYDVAAVEAQRADVMAAQMQGIFMGNPSFLTGPISETGSLFS
ncbi:MAG: D-alanyl-D-alanine carboxypeptidase family protein [Armatimonadota bacterium]|nr:D-alanyl-D-alanine carboxypeptidase family protein [Armatimonadota bacterium]